MLPHQIWTSGRFPFPSTIFIPRNPQLLDRSWDRKSYCQTCSPRSLISIVSTSLHVFQAKVSIMSTPLWFCSLFRRGVPSPSPGLLLRERQRFSAELPTTAPSTLGSPSDFSKFQEKQNQKIVWSRPRAADATIPVTLLHPIFRQFVDNCKSHQPIQEDNNLVLELMGAMSDFFPNEKARAARLRAILTKHGIPVHTSTITSKDHHFPTDGAVSINGHLVAIIEVKGEIGSTGAEPYAQVILYYSHSNAVKSQEFSQFNFPSLLITVFGQILLSSLAIL